MRLNRAEVKELLQHLLLELQCTITWRNFKGIEFKI